MVVKGKVYSASTFRYANTNPYPTTDTFISTFGITQSQKLTNGA